MSLRQQLVLAAQLAEARAELAAERARLHLAEVERDRLYMALGTSEVDRFLMRQGRSGMIAERDAALRERDDALIRPEEARRPVVVPEDTRPLIDGAWREAHPDEWDRLCVHPETCPVCMEVPLCPWDSAMICHYPTRCTHWVCDVCWDRIAGGDRRCPICRDDLTTWLMANYGSEDSDDDMSDSGDDASDADDDA